MQPGQVTTKMESYKRSFKQNWSTLLCMKPFKHFTVLLGNWIHREVLALMCHLVEVMFNPPYVHEILMR